MKPMVILTGPTAVGKTELSIRLAKIKEALPLRQVEINPSRKRPKRLVVQLPIKY